MIVEKQAKSKWGDGVIDQLSKDLRSEFSELRGFSLTNLKYIRKWVQFYTLGIGPHLVDQLKIAGKIPQVEAQLQLTPAKQNRKSRKSRKKSPPSVDPKSHLSTFGWG